MLSGHVFRRQMWAPAINGIGGGVLPTPKAGDGERGRDKARARPDTKGRELATVVRDQMLPTPNDGEAKQSGNVENWKRRRLEHLAAGQDLQMPLAVAVKMLPTPRTCSAMAARLDTAGNLESDRFPNLETVVARETLPTPTTRDWKDGSQQSCANVSSNGLLGRETHRASVPTGAAMYLNPSFVEEMMGFPVGWTD